MQTATIQGIFLLLVLFFGGRTTLMVSVRDSGVSDPGSSPGCGTALCSWVRLSEPRCINGYHPSRVESLHATETRISFGLMGNQSRM